MRRLLETPFWRPLPVALAAVLGLAGGLGLAATQAPWYRSSVSMAVELERRPGSVGTSDGTERVRRRLPDIRRDLTQVEVLEDVLRVVDDVEKPATAEIERMRTALSFRSGEGNILRLEYVDGDPGRAAAIANGLAAHLVDQAESEPADPPAIDTEVLDAEMAVVRGQMDELVGDIEGLRAREGVAGVAQGRPRRPETARGRTPGPGPEPPAGAGGARSPAKPAPARSPGPGRGSGPPEPGAESPP